MTGFNAFKIVFEIPNNERPRAFPRESSETSAELYQAHRRHEIADSVTPTSQTSSN